MSIVSTPSMVSLQCSPEKTPIVDPSVNLEKIESESTKDKKTEGAMQKSNTD